MQQTPTPAPPPSPPPPPLPGVVDGTPAEIYRASQAQVRELREQLEQLEQRHGQLTGQIRETPFSETAIRKGLETRLGDIDQRIADVERQIAVARQRAVQYAGSAPPEPPPRREGPPEGVFVIPVAFIFFVLFPLTIAYTRRIWRRGAATVSTIPAELMERIGRIETAVDAVALEVERIGEGQRFVSRLFAEGGGRHLGVGEAQHVEAPAREQVPVGTGQRPGA